MSSQNSAGERFAAHEASNPSYNMQRPVVAGSVSVDSSGSLANNMQNLHISRPPPPPWAARAPVQQNMPNPVSGSFPPPGSRPVATPPENLLRPTAPPSIPHNATRPSPPISMASGNAARPGTPSSMPFSNAVRPGAPNLAPATNAARPGPPMPPPSAAATRPGPPLQPPIRPGAPRPQSNLSGPFSQQPNLSAPTSAAPLPVQSQSSVASDNRAELNNGPPSAPGSRPHSVPGNNAMFQPAVSNSQIKTVVAVSGASSPAMVPTSQVQAPGTRPPMSQTGFPSVSVPPMGFPSAAPPPSGFPQAVSTSQFQGPPYGTPQNNYPGFSMARPPPPPAGLQTPGVPGMPSLRPLNQQVPPTLPTMGHGPSAGLIGMTQPGSPATGTPGASRIDPNQIPRPQSSSDPLVFETRSNNQNYLPPPATSEFITRDTGNCSPRYMRCTINQIPCSGDLLGSTSGMPLALMVQPFALPHPSEEPIQLVDFGEGGPVRCSRCKAYINPFMRFIDQGRRFICNLCGCNNETPRDYQCNLGPDGRRRDADVRPELCRGAVEFVATKEYMVREPMPAVYFFLIDVSLNAIQTGATAATCSAISRTLQDLLENPRVRVGIATFDSTVHFYTLKRSLQQPSMLVVPDVQDVYTPLETDLIVPLSECRQILEQLLDNIPTMFKENKIPESAFGAAVKGAFLALKSTGGKLLVFQSVLSSVGIGALSAREAEGRAITSAGEKEAHKLLQPADKTYKTMAIEFAEYQVCVDLFLSTQTYVDIASISTVPRTTGGQIYYYYPFSAVADSAKLYNDLRWNVTRPQGFEAVMRVRCSQGLQVQEYHGNFCKRIPTDVDLPAIDCDKTIMVTFKHDDKFQEGSECCFQCAILYTTVLGERRIRVTTLSLPCTSVLSNLFRAADLDAQFTYFLKQAANQIPTTPLVQLREQITGFCVNILLTYRKYCATGSSSGQLILPEAMKLLPLYTLALTKSIGLRADVRVDDRSYWINRVASLSASLAVPLVYPRLYAIHGLSFKDDGGNALPPTLPLSSENIDSDGVYLLENGEDAFIYLGKSVNADLLQKLFGVQSMDQIPDQFVLQQFDNDLSRKLNDVVNEIRRQRCSYLRLRVCKRGDPTEFLFYSFIVEDKNNLGTSYVDYLVHIHRQIQNKMS
eukprot:TRINITY_DN4950_c0_g1_i1.p1 TRINITY_DN4950_c0_g1~~TRINITY_DN4950_c0_g1_i1.p1  ORF type:complete len:1152 (-),score=243.05 TRINITY_DN4950_c0_g1_i1:556-4011(-)